MYLRGLRGVTHSTLVFAGMFMVAPQLMAASFQVLEQSSSGLGTAFAGTAATANDATTAFYNPAGLTRLRGQNATVSMIGIFPQIKLNATQATPPKNYPTVSPANIGPAHDRVRGKALVPAGHYAYSFNNKWAMGFSITAPYGLISKYHDNSVARYMATGTSLKTMNYGPSIAYRINDDLSVGGGIDYMAVRVKLDTAIGFGNSAVQPDGYNNSHARGHGWGWHLGALWSTEDTSMGLNYRSQVRVKVNGTQHVNLVSAGAAPFPPVVSNLPASSRITLPDTLTYSIQQKFDDRWTGLADAQWTHWKKFDRLVITNSAGLNTTTLENYRNAYRVSLGGLYRYDDRMSFRIGTAFDKSPAQAAYRTARIPDSDRVWLALGGRYRLNRGFVVDAGLAHIFFKKSALSENPPTQSGPGAAVSTATMKALYKGNANVVGIQLSWNPV